MQQPPSPPYYAVIFTSELIDGDSSYSQMAERMIALAGEQPGFLGIESVREGSRGLTVSYWESEAAVTLWKSNLEHLQAQELGRKQWYARYTVEVSRVERSYSFGDDA